MNHKFKIGDKVRIKHTEELIEYFSINGMDIDDIFLIKEEIDSMYPIFCESDKYGELSFKPSELILYVKDNAMNRLLYPELKSNGKGYLE